MKIYLAKSNKSNPIDVQWVRNMLTNLGHEVVEFNGGKYDPNEILKTDFVVAVSHPVNQPNQDFKYVGRGTFDQLDSAIKKGIPCAIVHSADELDVKISPVIKVEVFHTDDWTFEYGIARHDEHQIPIREVLGQSTDVKAPILDDDFLASL